MNDSYQESYQSWEIVDYEEFPNGGWPESRRCGYRFFSDNFDHFYWEWYVATSSGGYERHDNWDNEQRCNCPTKYGPYTADDSTYTNNYTAMCQHRDWISVSSYHQAWHTAASADWVRQNTCPKGWGDYHGNGTDKPYVQCAQGYVPSGYREPVYGYVTRYRDVYYDYISTRISKI